MTYYFLVFCHQYQPMAAAKKIMLQFAFVLLYAQAHTTSALFFHEKSSIVLIPAGGYNNISFGYSLGYQHGEHPNLVIGAPLYDLTGRVYQRSIEEILNGTTTCDPLDIDFDALNITYNRDLSPDQHFYLGASIAATENFFMTTAPLRPAHSKIKIKNGTISPLYGPFSACVIYNNSKIAQACRHYGVDDELKRKQLIKEYMYGSGGWSSMVDEDKRKIIVSKSFGVRDVVYGTMDPSDGYVSLKSQRKLARTTKKDITNYGKAMTVGNYFDKDVKKTYYAFSSRDKDGRGGVDFYSSDSKWTKLDRLDDSSVGSMFGTSLCSADVTGDGRSELFVGAPAHAADATSCDRGAVHIYTKSDADNRKTMVLKLTLWGVKDGGHFGTTSSAKDVNGDSYPEIFISAPFENSGVGALYILCGYEIHGLIEKKKILVSELRRTQRIEKEAYRAFGYSLQSINDFNENGGDELAVGAPGNSRVLLFSGVRAITVKVTSKFADIVLKTDSGHPYLNFSSCVTVDLPQEPKTITTKLLVTNVITGKGIFNNSIEATYVIDLATEEGIQIADNRVEYCKHMYIVDPSFCVVNTTVSTVENIQDQEVFDSSWVTLSALSELTKFTPATVFECLCQNASCSPELYAELHWSGSNDTDDNATYLIGSSVSETVNVVVHNYGTKGCSSCAVVRVSGKLGLQLQCQATDLDRQYMCALPNPFMGNTSHLIEIQLSMDGLSSRESNVAIDVEVRKNCDEPEPEAVTSLTVSYSFDDVLDNVILNGSNVIGEISDKEIENEDEELILEQTYTILNNRSFIWKHIGVRLNASNKPYIQNFKVVIKNTEKYDEFNGTDDFIWQNTLNLAPYTEYEVTIFTTILKKEIATHLEDGCNITISSELALDLFRNETKSKALETVLTYKKEKTIWNNKRLITIIALIIALLLLIIVTMILYKLNFFRRKNKEKLKKEIRRRSIRRESSRRRPQSGQSEARTSSHVDNTEAGSLSWQPDVELIIANNVEPAQVHEDEHAHCD